MKKMLIVSVILGVLTGCLAACAGTPDTTKSITTTDTEKDDGVTTSEVITEATSETTPETDEATTTPVTNSLSGKKFLFLGSSVTYGSASGGYSMADHLSATENCYVIKEAVSGTTLVDSGENSYVQRLFKSTKKYKNTKFDHVIVQLSTNDASKGKPLGKVSSSFEINDFDTTTVAGAIEYIIALSKDTWNCDVSFYTGTKYENKNYEMMVELLLEIQEKWDIGVIDLYNDPEMNAVSSSDYERYMDDPRHPTRVGYEEWWTPKFKEHLEKYQ
jgi:lysophospholipase L1-like esterase